MKPVLLLALVVLSAFIIAWGFSRRDRVLQFPTLLGIAFAGYLLPQFFALSSHNIPPWSFEKTAFMALLCLSASFIGYYQSARPVAIFQRWEFTERRLIAVSAGCMAIGGFFFYQVSLLAPEVSLETGGQWSGPITILIFFARLLTVGFVIAVILHMRRPSLASYCLLGLGLPFYFDRIVLQGRRGDLVELLVFFGFALYFGRHWRPARWVAAAIAIGSILFINSIGPYRALMLQEDRTTWTGAGIEEIMSIDFIGNLRASFTDNAPDIINAVYLIHAANEDQRFDFGTSLYNDLIQRYIPGQIIGYDVKNALKVDVGVQDLADFGYVQRTGTTVTGIASAFLSFWYFGALLFWAIAHLMRKWYLGAVNGNIGAQCVLLLITYSSIRSMPFSTNRFFLEFVNIAVFLVPALWIARLPAGSRNRVDAHRAPRQVAGL